MGYKTKGQPIKRLKTREMEYREIKPKARFASPHGEYVEVMAVVDYYVMARYKGAIPFVMRLNKFAQMVAIHAQSIELMKKYEPQASTDGK